MNHILHYNIVIILVFHYVKNMHDVRMYKFVKSLKFLIHKVQIYLLIIKFLLTDNFDGTRHITFDAKSFPNFSKRTLSNFLLEIVNLVNINI